MGKFLGENGTHNMEALCTHLTLNMGGGGAF